MAKDKRIEFERKSLRKWIELEEARAKIKEVFRTRDGARAASSIFDYIREACKNCEDVDLRKLDSITALNLFVNAKLINSPTKNFPILKQATDDKEKLPWEYEGRTWYFWANLFSKHYGWTMGEIAELDIDDAIGLYQELEIDRQLDREWDYGLSELAYPYDSTTKTGKFKPLPRPGWMMPIIPKPKAIRIRKDMIPVGNIEGKDDLDKIFNP